jgi:hypothetical protein
MCGSMETDEKVKSLTDALTAFKDWSNYLLITTVAALGWLGSENSPKGWASVISIGLLCLSVIFGIFTLALIPIIREQIPEHVKEHSKDVKDVSFYDIKPKFRFFPFLKEDPRSREYLNAKAVCWPQHILFILGIIFYAVAAVASRLP